ATDLRAARAARLAHRLLRTLSPRVSPADVPPGGGGWGASARLPARRCCRRRHHRAAARRARSPLWIERSRGHRAGNALAPLRRAVRVAGGGGGLDLAARPAPRRAPAGPSLTEPPA